MSDACVRFVEAAVGLKLDFSPETLPLLDHYISSRFAGERPDFAGGLAGERPDFAGGLEGRGQVREHPEVLGLVARAAGAYFGEVVRRQFRSFWHAPSDDPSTWELRLEPVYLSFNPIAVAYDAITHGDEAGPTAHIQLDDEDRVAVEERLAELPSASDEEFFSFSTRLEVLEIAVEAIKARMMSSGLGDVAFGDEDYS